MFFQEVQVHPFISSTEAKKKKKTTQPTTLPKSVTSRLVQGNGDCNKGNMRAIQKLKPLHMASLFDVFPIL